MRIFRGNRRSRRLGWLGAAVLVGGGAAGGAIASGVSASGATTGDNSSHLSSSVRSGEATAVPQQLSSAYSVFGRAKAGFDNLPTAAAAGTQATGGMFNQYGLNPALARYVGSANGTAMWLVPGSAGSCLILATGGGSCGATDLIAQQGIVVGLVPTSGAPASVLGVVPDKAHVTATDSAGAQQSVGLSGNAFGVTAAAHTASFTIDESNGGKTTQTLPSSGPPAPPPPPGG